jgi:DNA mismatch endonuclease (patch repair protein)
MGRTRSQQMSRIRGKDTSPEMLLRRALWAAGLRYRIHYRTPAGRADLALVGPAVAVYIDGCFWHGCPEHYVRPRSRIEFWSAKLSENVARDRRQTLHLEAAGWRICRLWEHEIFETLPEVIHKIQSMITEAQAPGVSWRVVKAEALPEQEKLERWTLQDLRDPSIEQVIERIRTTDKWKKPTRQDSESPDQ